MRTAEQRRQGKEANKLVPINDSAPEESMLAYFPGAQTAVLRKNPVDWNQWHVTRARAGFADSDFRPDPDLDARVRAYRKIEPGLPPPAFAPPPLRRDAKREARKGDDRPATVAPPKPRRPDDAKNDRRSATVCLLYTSPSPRD